MVNILEFYIVVAYGIALWGAYICWESEKEEIQLQQAMKKYMKKISQREKDSHMMIDMEKGSGKKLLSEKKEKAKKKKKSKKSSEPKQLQIMAKNDADELD